MTANHFSSMPEQVTTPAYREPPRGFFASIRYFGPGLILSASIVGSGELIATTALGAKAGFGLMWVILIACLFKVAVQLQYGRHCICHGQLTYQAWNSVIGPRFFGINWSVYFGFLFLVVSLAGQGGIIGGAAQVVAFAFPGVPIVICVAVIAVSLSLLVYRGGYGRIQNIAIGLNIFFTTIILFCVFAVQKTQYAYGWADIAGGFSFKLPSELWAIALTVFAITGVAAGEIFTYPYWCLEKGYAAWTGPRDDSPEWASRARGWMRVMTLDALLSMVVYTVATFAFYILGASVLNPQESLADGPDLILQLSAIFTDVLGPGTRNVFMLGAFAVLFSTVFANAAGYARQWADLFGVCRVIDTDKAGVRTHWIAIMSWFVPACWGITYLLYQNPLYLVILNGLSNALFLVVIAIQAMVFRYRYTDPRLIPTRWYDAALWLAIASITFMAWRTMQSLFDRLF